MNVNQLRGPMAFDSQLAGASRGAFGAARTKKKTFGQKLGSFAKDVASVGLQVAGAGSSLIPGGSVLKGAIGSALSGAIKLD